MANPLEFFFDYISPFSYLADTQLPALLERTGAGIVYKPILLGGIFKASNNTPPPAIPAKFKYNAVDAMEVLSARPPFSSAMLCSGATTECISSKRR